MVLIAQTKDWNFAHLGPLFLVGKKEREALCHYVANLESNLENKNLSDLRANKPIIHIFVCFFAVGG